MISRQGFFLSFLVLAVKTITLVKQAEVPRLEKKIIHSRSSAIAMNAIGLTLWSGVGPSDNLQRRRAENKC